MELTISGLKCDYCDYRDESVQFSEYQESINKPCPECGQSLLTEKEYNNCLAMYKRVEHFKKAINILKWLNPFHYWRLIFGDKREITTVSGEFPKRFE